MLLCFMPALRTEGSFCENYYCTAAYISRHFAGNCGNRCFPDKENLCFFRSAQIGEKQK